MSFFFQGNAGTAPRLTITGAATTLQNVTGATVACWVTYTGPVVAVEHNVVNVSSGLSLAQSRANISLRHQLGLYRVSARRLDADAVVTVDSTTAVSATPTHVAGVFEYNNQIARIYVNGVQQNTVAVPGWTGATSPTASLGAAIGCRADADPTTAMTGLVSNVGVWNRALSAAEIANLFFCQGRHNGFFGLGNLFRLQGVALNAAVPAGGTPDSVGTLAAVPAGGPPLLLGSNYIAVNRRRRRR